VKLKAIVAFVPTRDATRARAFYENVIGLRFVQDDGFAIVMDFKGTMVRIAKVGEYQPFPFTMLGWEVDDISTTVRALTGKGATVERYSFLEQDELGVWAAPGGAKVAWFKDPDGNLLSLSQHPAPARTPSKSKSAARPNAREKPKTAARGRRR